MDVQHWRTILIGKHLDLYRKGVLTKFKSSKFDEDIQKDLPRTYPTQEFFKYQKKPLENLIRTYCVHHPAMGYFQGLCFLAYPLYYAYYLDNPSTVVHDVYYSLLEILKVLRPTLPLHQNDKNALDTIKRLCRVVEFKLQLKDERLYKSVMEHNIPLLIMVQAVPCFFANKFSLNDTLLLWDYIFSTCKSSESIMEKMLDVFVAMIIYHKYIYLYGSLEEKLLLPSKSENNNAKEIIKIIKLF